MFTTTRLIQGRNQIDQWLRVEYRQTLSKIVKIAICSILILASFLLLRPILSIFVASIILSSTISNIMNETNHAQIIPQVQVHGFWSWRSHAHPLPPQPTVVLRSSSRPSETPLPAVFSARRPVGTTTRLVDQNGTREPIQTRLDTRAAQPQPRIQPIDPEQMFQDFSRERLERLFLTPMPNPTSLETYDYGFQDYVDHTNTRNLNQAREANRDGGELINQVLKDFKSKLSPEEQIKFIEKIKDRDPEVFVEVPQMVVKFLVKTSSPLCTRDIPNFALKYFSKLEGLRRKINEQHLSVDSKDVKNDIGDIGIKLARDTNFIAACEAGFNHFSS